MDLGFEYTELFDLITIYKIMERVGYIRSRGGRIALDSLRGEKMQIYKMCKPQKIEMLLIIYLFIYFNSFE